MAAPHEAATFRYSKGAYGCFVGRKKKDQLVYGYLHHNIGFTSEEDCGTFVMEDGTMETFSLRIVDAATLRLLKGDKHFCPCHQGFEAAKDRLRKVDAQLIETNPNDWQQIRAVMQAESIRKYRLTNPLKIARPPPVQKPKPPVLLYAKKTLVAARAGTFAPFTVLEPWTACGWWGGSIVRVESTNLLQPYVIRFSTKPKPVQVRVSEPIVRALVWNYEYCDQHCIFQGIVGQELLWPCLSPQLNTVSLRLTKVLELNRLTQLYKLSFRDGQLFEITGPVLDRATTREEHIRNGEEVSVDVKEGEPSLVRFTQAHIDQACREQGRYKMTGPQMTKGTNATKKDGTESSADGLSTSDESESDEESASDEASDASTASNHAPVSAKNKTVARAKATRNQDHGTVKTQPIVTRKESKTEWNGADASHGPFKGNSCTCFWFLCKGF